MSIWDDAAAGGASGAAAGPWGAVIGAGIGLFGSLFGAYKQSQAAENAARITAEAQTRIAEMNAAAQRYAAELQAKGSADALAFSKSGAENAFQNNEVSRQGNYDQWAAAQRRIGSVAKLLGFGDREIPAYRPGVDPHFDGSGGATTPLRPLASGIDPSNPGAGISAYFKAQGVGDSETPYWVSQWPALLARGQELNDPTYALKRLAAAEIFRGAPMPSVAATLPPAPMTTPGSPYAVANFLRA